MANIIRPPLTGDAAQDSWNNQVSILLNSGVIGGSQTGANTNSPGRNGVNSATITLYQRTETNLQPTVLPDQSTYTYETSTLTPNGNGSLNGWSQTFDNGTGLYLWSIIRYASGTAETETVSSGDWSTPALISSPGASTGFRIDTSYAEELGVTTDVPTKEIQAFTFTGPLAGEVPAVIGVDGVAEVQDVALTGTLAGPVEEVIGVDAVAEIQDITVAGTLAAAVEGVIGVDAVAEVQDVAVAGTLAGVVAAVAEVDSVGWSGTRSNVFVAANNEIITVSLIDDFNSGVTQSDTQLDLETESNSVLHEIGNTYSWPTGDLGDASLPTGWDYIAGLGSGTSSAATAGQIVNNTGAAVSLNNASVSVTINVTALPADGTTQPGFFVQQGFAFVFIASRTINAIGSYTYTDNTVQNPISLADGEALSLFMFESTTADQGFTYTVTDVQLNTGVTLNAAYNLDVDTSDTVFVGNVTNSFGEDEDATDGVGQIGTDVTTMFPTITAGSVYSQNLPQVGATTTNATRDTDGFIPFLSWDVRDADNNSATSVNYATWNDWVGNFFAFSALASTFNDLTNLIVSEGIFSNVVLTITDNSNSNITATFNIDTITDISTDYFSLVSIVSQAGVPATSNVSWDLSLTGDVGFKSIDLNTNQIIDVAQSITTTANSGDNIIADVVASDGNASSGQASTYTVLDYSGTEVTAFTSFVSTNTETDLAAVLNTITTAINSNIEVPIDFMAVQNATLNRFDLTAVSGGAITGSWSITVNHHGQATDAGDIAFGNTVVQTAGANEIAAEQAVVTFTSPQSEVSNTITTSGPKTAAEITTDLNTFLMVSGWTVALADTVTLRFTADVAEAVSGLFSSVDTNSHVTTTTTVSTEGVDGVEAVAPVDAETAEITITSPQGSASNTRTLTGPQTTAEIVTDLAANLIVSGWGVSENAGLLRLTADVAEAVDGSFVYADTQPHTSGVIATVVEGVDGVAPVSPEDAQTMSLVFTSPDSVASTALALTGPQTQGAIIQYVIDNLVVVGWTVSLSGSNVRLTADVDGAVEGEFTAVDSENNVSSVVSVVTEGADEVLPADAIPAQTTDITFTSPEGNTSSTTTLTGPLTNAEINTAIAATTVDEWTVSEVGGAASFEADEAGNIIGRFSFVETQSLLSHTLEVTDGADQTVTGGTYRFPTGRIIDNDYLPLTRAGDEPFTGTRSLYWTGEDEPFVSTNPALYNYERTAAAAGIDAVTINATSNDYSIIYDADGLNPTPATVTLTGTAQNVANGFFRFTGGGDDFPDETTFTDGDTALTAARTFTAPTSITDNTVRNFNIAVADGDQTELAFDTLTLNLFQAGTDGIDALTVILQNEATALPASATGTVTSYTGSDNGIEVYRGSTQLTYTADAGDPSTSEFKISAVGTDITVGAITLDGQNAAVAEASAFTETTDTSMIVFTITVRNEADDANLTFTKVQNFTKSKGGIDGFNQAVVSVYKRSATEPTDAPTEVGTYTFSTAALLFGTEVSSNGWFNSADGPSGTDQLYIRQASAVSRDATDTIAVAEWSGVIMAGTEGIDGLDGINTATVFLYQRNNSETTAPDDPTLADVYTFMTGALTLDNNNGWTRTQPDITDGSVLWITFATPASRMATVAIPASQWSDPEILAVNGATGAAGVDSVTISATSNDYSIIYDADGSNPTPATVTLTGTAQNVANGFFRFTGGGDDFPDETTFTDGDTALTATRTFTLPTSITANTVRTFNVAVADGNQDELAFDTFTINLFQTATDGTDGEDAFTVILQNEATALPASNAGVVSSYSGSDNEVEAYRGSTQLTYTAAAGDPSTSEFKVSLVATNITAGAITLSDQNAAVADASAFTDSEDVASIVFTITIRNEADDANLTFTKVQNFTKSKGGAAGAGGVDSVVISATSNDYSIIYDADGSNPTPATVTLTGTAQNVANGFFRFTGGGDDFPDETTFTDGDTALTATRAFVLPASITDNTVRTFNVAVADGDQDELAFDTFTINLFQTATDGTDGVDGVDAFTVILQNEATALPASNAGVVSSYSGSDNEIEVYKGTAQLTYTADAGDPSALEFKVSLVATNITAGAITLSGQNAAVADASAFTDSEDVASIVFTITVRNQADDGNLTFTKVQSFTKSKIGGVGAGGVDAVTISATANDYSVIYDSAGLNPTPTTVTLTGTAQNVANGFFRFTGGGDDFPDETTFTDGDTALTATRTFTLPTSITANTTRSFNIAVADGDQTELAFDTLTITMLLTRTDGADGENAITFLVSNEAAVLPATSAGVVTSYSGSSTVVEVYRGSTELSYIVPVPGVNPTPSEFQLFALGTLITAGDISAIAGANGANIDDASSFDNGSDEASIDIVAIIRNEADDANIILTKTQTLTKSRRGVDGAGGVDSVVVSLTADDYSVIYDESSENPDPATIELTATAQNVTNGFFKFTGGGSEFPDETTFTDGDTATTATRTYTLASSFIGEMVRNFTVAVADGDQTELAFDTLTITVFITASDGTDGTNGTDGAKGEDGYTVVIYNEATALPASATGVVSSYSGSDNGIEVYRGSTQLEFSNTSINPALTEFILVVTDTNITAGAVTKSGDIALIADASAFVDSADTATIDFAIQVQEENDPDSVITFEKTQNITKSKGGTDGFNQAVVTVYKRSATVPTDAPTGVGTYTFSTAVLLFGTEVSSNGWFNSADGPSGTDQLYIRQASAVSRDATDTIAVDEWSSVITAGSAGLDGLDGINTATVYLYQRNSSETIAPADPTLADVYTFSTGALTIVSNNGWTRTQPDITDGVVLWITFATPASRMATVAIPASQWSDPEILAVNGATGAAGEDSVTISATSNDYSIIYDANGANPTPATVTLTGTAQNVVNGFFRFTGGGSDFPDETTFTDGDTALTATRTFTAPTSITDNTIRTFSIAVADGDQTELAFDTLTLNLFQTATAGTDGTDGTNGTDGRDAFTVILQNEATALPASATGVVSSYAGSDNEIEVYRGSTQLTYSAAAGDPSTNQFKISLVGTNITVGAITPSGSNAVIADASAFTDSENVAMIVVTITVRNEANDGNLTFTKVQSFTKSRRGTTGAAGTDGTNGTDGGRGAGIWPHRVGTTLADSYTQAQLDAFLAAAVPGTDDDDPVDSDQLWLYASPSLTDLDATDQAVYLYSGTTWTLQNIVLDGNVLINGTVSADKMNVSEISAISADIGDVTAGTIQGGTIPDADAAPSGTESGSFFDLSGGKFVVGDADNYVLFNGTNVSVGGDIITTGNIRQAAVTVDKIAVDAYVGTSFRATYTDNSDVTPSAAGNVWIGTSSTDRAANGAFWETITHLRFYILDDDNTDFSNILENLTDQSFIRLFEDDSNFVVLSVNADAVRTADYYTITIDNSSVLQSLGLYSTSAVYTINFKVTTEAYVDGNLVVDQTIRTSKLVADDVVANTVRSTNYVAPTLAQNPPNVGYSLEHLEGIGFFEEIRANLTGFLTAPSQTPSEGTYLYNTTAITTEYLDISVGETWDDFPVTHQGVTQIFKGKLSEPVYELTLPTNLENNLTTSASTPWSGGSLIDYPTQYQFYSNLSANNLGASNYYIQGVWVGYDADDNMVGEIGYTILQSNDIVISSGVLLDIATNTRLIDDDVPTDTVDFITDFSSFPLSGVELSAVAPVTAKFHFRVISFTTTSHSTVATRPTNTSPIAITVGILANSAIQFDVKSNDGTANVDTITQLNT